jgi:hypothetical protein
VLKITFWCLTYCGWMLIPKVLGVFFIKTASK